MSGNRARPYRQTRNRSPSEQGSVKQLRGSKRPKLDSGSGQSSTESKSDTFSICQIRPYLFISGFRSISAERIKELGITHIVDAANIFNARRIPDVNYFDVKIDDDELGNIQQHFESVAKFIQDAKNSNGKILVCCAAGISRSAALCMMYLVISEGVSLRNSFIEVGKARPMIYPNLGFWRQMTDYETNKTGTSSVTLLKRGRLFIPDVYINKTLDNLIRDQTE